MRKRERTAGLKEGFTSERALCEVLESAVRALEWKWYPETSGWDAIIVLPDETQVGVQAKLRANVEVLDQAMPPLVRRRGWPMCTPRVEDLPGPDVRLVLVPEADERFRSVASHLRLAVAFGGVLRGDRAESFWWDGKRGAGALKGGPYLERVVEDAPRWPYSKREWLPPFEPARAAGVPSPRTISPWRITAAKLCAEIRAGLRPTAKDLEARGMVLSRWRNWLDPVEGTKPRQYAPRDGAYLPDTAWPDVALGLGLPAPPSIYKREPEPHWSPAWIESLGVSPGRHAYRRSVSM